MNGKYFLDTNIFVYSFDKSSPQKKQKAAELIKNTLATNRGIISYQVIQEFLNVATRKFKEVLSVADCKEYVNNFLSPICEVFPTTDLYILALDIHSNSKIGFYDSLIIASASKAKCKLIYSEDLNAGQTINGVQIQNPFNS
jgi:predicted nucleic acid-binding protein